MTVEAEVVQALLDVLVGVEGNTDLSTAPAGTPRLYGVLELAAGPKGDGGDLGDAGRHLTVAFNVRSVCRLQNIGMATLGAVDLAARYALALKGELTGDGWRATVTQLGTSGAEPEGNVVNVVDSYSAWVVPA